MFSSEPTGADIYVDAIFMGNTPSQILLAAGSHSVRIEAKGQKPWSRPVTLTAGGKVTLHNKSQLLEALRCMLWIGRDL